MEILLQLRISVYPLAPLDGFSSNSNYEYNASIITLWITSDNTDRESRKMALSHKFQIEYRLAKLDKCNVFHIVMLKFANPVQM